MKKIIVASLMRKTKSDFINKEIETWKKYFDVDVTTLEPKKIETLIKKKIDVLLLDSKDENLFKLEYYRSFKSNNYRFKYIIIKDEPMSSDSKYYKKLADRIVYIVHPKLASWELISVLRRFWGTNSKPTTIIFRSIIADFVENTISIEGVVKDLTVKEINVLRILLQNKEEFVSRKVIYKAVWKHDDDDKTRVLDQIIFKLKKKLGKNYFEVSRSKGIKIT